MSEPPRRVCVASMKRTPKVSPLSHPLIWPYCIHACMHTDHAVMSVCVFPYGPFPENVSEYPDNECQATSLVVTYMSYTCVLQCKNQPEWI